jgi:hypothetical protein
VGVQFAVTFKPVLPIIIPAAGLVGEEETPGLNALIYLNYRYIIKFIIIILTFPPVPSVPQ